jgi:hypothetical protein
VVEAVTTMIEMPSECEINICALGKPKLHFLLRKWYRSVLGDLVLGQEFDKNGRAKARPFPENCCDQ